MSLTEILAEVDQLTDEERTVLARKLWVAKLVADPVRTAEIAACFERMRAGIGVVTEEELRARLVASGKLPG